MSLKKKLDKGAKTKAPVETRANVNNQSIKDISTGKKVERVLTEAPECTQDAVEIYRIHEDGIFEIQPGVYSKSYYFYSGQYWLLGEESKILLADKDTKMRVGLNCDLQYTYIRRPLKYETTAERTEVPVDKCGEIGEALNKFFVSKQYESTGGFETVRLITLTVREKSITTARAELLQREEELRKGSAETGSRITPLSTTDRLLVFRDFYRRKDTSKLLHHDYSGKKNNAYDFRNDIAPEIMVQKPNSLQLDDHTFIRVMYAAEYGDELEDDIIHSLLSLPYEMVLSINHTEIPRAAVNKRTADIMYNIERKKQKEQQNNNKNGFYNQGFSYRLQKEEEHAHKFAAEVENENIYFVSATLAITADSEEELDKAQAEVEAFGEKKQVRFCVHTNLQREGLATALPHGARYTKTMRSMVATSAFCWHPYWSTEIMENGVCYGVNRITQNPILVDRRSLDNPHALIFGSSGSSKSGEEKLEIMQVILKSMGRVVVFDPTGEYKALCKPFNGTYVDISLKSDIKINPMEIPQGRIYERDFASKKSSLMCSILRNRMGNACTSNHTTILDAAICTLYDEFFRKREKKGLFAKDNSNLQPTLKDLELHIRSAAMNKVNELGEHTTGPIDEMYRKTAEECVMAFSILTTGSLDFFSGTSNLDIWDNDIVCIGFSDVPKDMYDIAVIIFLDYIESVASANLANGIDTYFTIDELHELIKSPLIADYLTTRWKTARHAGLILTGILQDVSNLSEHPVCRQLLSNSSTTIVMKQDPSTINTIIKECGLSADEARYAAGCLQGEGVVKFGQSVLPFNARIPDDQKTGALWNILNTDTIHKHNK